MSRDVMQEIKEEIGDNTVVLYMKGTAQAPRCGFSAAAVDVLRQLDVPFKDVNVLDDQDKWAAIKQYTEWPTIPQLYVKGEFIGGCDIMRDLFFKGELQPIVAKAFD